MKSQCESDATANIFQKKAFKKFLMTVPGQMAGNCATGSPAKMRLSKMEAAGLMMGHMTAVVLTCRMRKFIFFVTWLRRGGIIVLSIKRV